MLGAHVMQVEPGSSNISLTLEMVGTSGASGNSSATMQIEVAEKKKRCDCCHCQNLTVLWRARLKFVHSSRPIQGKSFVSWRKQV